MSQQFVGPAYTPKWKGSSYFRFDTGVFQVNVPGAHIINGVADSTVATFALNASTIYAQPFVMGLKGRLVYVVYEITTGASSTIGGIHVGIYRTLDQSRLLPGALLKSNDEQFFRQDSAFTLGNQTFFIFMDLVLNPGIYWVALGSNAAHTLRGIGASAIYPLLGTDNTMNTALGVGLQTASAPASSRLPGYFPLGNPTIITTTGPEILGVFDD